MAPSSPQRPIANVLAELRDHPDYVFGSTFTTIDFPDDQDRSTLQVDRCEEAMTEAGWRIASSFIDDTNTHAAQ